MPWRLRVAAPARKDIKDLLRWSEEQFGAAARGRYEALFRAAIGDIREDPYRIGSRPMPEIPGVRNYHLRHSRMGASGVAGLDLAQTFRLLSSEPPP
jgi:toxin ParE1/3/4